MPDDDKVVIELTHTLVAPVITLGLVVTGCVAIVKAVTALSQPLALVEVKL